MTVQALHCLYFSTVHPKKKGLFFYASIPGPRHQDMVCQVLLYRLQRHQTATQEARIQTPEGCQGVGAELSGNPTA